MSHQRVTYIRTLSAGAAAALVLTGLGQVAMADDPTYTYTKIDQSQMSVVDVNSVEAQGEMPNGPAERILDGDISTYWHTKWHGGIVQPPHHVTVRLGGQGETVNLGKIDITPRQSSSGSGRARAWQLWTSADPNCAADTFTKQAEGEFPGEVATYAEVRTITLAAPVQAACAKFLQLTSWGGKQGSDIMSPPESVASMAEFNAYTATAQTVEPQPEPQPDPGVPADKVVTLTDGTLSVRMHTDFPQVIGWNLGGVEANGNTGAALTTIRINQTDHAVTVTPATTQEAHSATWGFAVNDTNITFKARATVEDGTWKLTLLDLADPDNVVKQIAFPGLNLVTLKSSDPQAQVTSTRISVNRLISGDRFDAVASMSPETYASYMVIPSTSTIAFGMESNAIEDNTTTYAGSNRGSNAKWIRVSTQNGSVKSAAISPGNFVWRGSSASAIGYDEAPWIAVRPTVDANNDSTINWQDGAIALRALRPAINGADDVANTVITRIPFNIVSQATHPFLRTLDDTKRIALATDNLRQQVMLKGYQAEGHDSAHPDYAGHYNERAGGLDDLKTLVNEGKNWNATFGVHVNATESYSESHNFSEDLLRMPPQAAWGWMNQSYYIDGPKDLGTGNILRRFQAFKDEVPENLNWLYIDVYYPNGWEPARLGTELQKQGWVVGTEWADKFPEISIWSHWANEERYGGQTNKGINSTVFRFVENSRRDIFNPDPILSNSNIVEFEGWTGNVDYNLFIKNVWERNLPVKFLQQSDIMKWETGEITFANGTVARSSETSASGTVVPTNRTIDYDGATVYTQGRYLLPWSDGGQERLYHWNPAGGTSTWTLTQAWANQPSLTLYKLTDTGRERVGDIAVSGGQISINAEAGSAYVLYPSTTVAQAKAPHWGQGSQINDPGFFSGTLDAWETVGNVSIEKSARGNFQALVGEGEAVIAQELAGGNLPAGTWNASAWVEIDPTGEREVSLSVTGDGVTATPLQTVSETTPVTTISTTRARNATASDEKLRTYFQRMRVTFTTDGNNPIVLALNVADGNTAVRVDDFRIVPFTEASAPQGATSPIVFEDFEHPDAGYWPFVTGIANSGGDARTQLAERHEPYSQRGWWGKNANGQVVEGGKLVDNVLSGNWSLQAHEENNGLILRTTTATVPFKAGHTYRISMDYQSGLADRYRFVTGVDSVADGQNRSTMLDAYTFGATTQTERFVTELTVGACGSYWFGIQKIAAGFQADLTMDNILVEDLGTASTSPACAELAITPATTLLAGVGATVTTTVTSAEREAASALRHNLAAPEGWTVVPLEVASDTMEANGTSVQRWIVTPPSDASGSAQLQAQASYTINGQVKTVSTSRNVDVLTEGLKDGDNYLSDLPFAQTPTNGWGPVERDMSNGEQELGDGDVLSIGGEEFEKGLGTHAVAVIPFDLGGACTSFSATVGLDDAQATRGSVTFTVEDGNGRVLAGPTAVLGPNDPGVQLTANVTGVDRLVLKVGNGGDNAGNDWASWGNAKVTCTVAAPQGQPTLTVTPTEVEAGGQYSLAVSHFAPEGSSGDVVIRDSAGTEVATLTPDSQGNARTNISVPADAQPGLVTLTAVRALGDRWVTATASVTITAKTPVVAQAQLDKTEVKVGDTVHLTGSGFAPGEVITLEMHSDPVPLGTVAADAQGKIDARVTIGSAVAAGDHTLVLIRPAGAQALRIPITVTASSPTTPIQPQDPTPTDPGNSNDSAGGQAGSAGQSGSTSGKVPAKGSSSTKKSLATTGANTSALLVGAALIGGLGLMARRRFETR